MMHQVSKHKCCLIGLGVITQKYFTGLQETDFIELAAVSDINENAVSRQLYSRYPYYQDYQEMIAREAPEYVIVSTPPKTHFAIVEYCLRQGVNVIVEKPVTLCIEDFDALMQLAEEKKLTFRTLFHWHGGVELQAFTQKYDTSRIEEIQVHVRDPYCDDRKTINADRRPLQGAWIDSGVNILSMIHTWLPFSNVEIVATDVQKCPQTGLPAYAKVNLLVDGVKTEIIVDWRQGVDQKESFITVDGCRVHMNHTAQSITDGETVDYYRMPRLDQHYKNLFSMLQEGTNAEFSRAVHEILFKVSDGL